MKYNKLRKEPRQNGISKLEPSEFQIGDDDETYMIGAEVGYVMGLEKVNDFLNVPRDNQPQSSSEVLIPREQSRGQMGHVVSRNESYAFARQINAKVLLYALRLMRLNRPFYWDIIFTWIHLPQF